jgi:hypothetical protein
MTAIFLYSTIIPEAIPTRKLFKIIGLETPETLILQLEIDK